MATDFKAVCLTIWFPQHNNPRYTDLFPRLADIVQFYKIVLSRKKVIRAMQFRVYLRLRSIGYRIILPRLACKHMILFTVDYKQALYWPHSSGVVIDADDPLYTQEESIIFNLPQVKAIVVTTEKSKEILQRIGVLKPIYVIPQGVDFEKIIPARIHAIQAQFKQKEEIVVGYHAPTLTMAHEGSKRARRGMDDLDFLFTTFEEAWKVEPRIRLWLLGNPSQAVQEYAKHKHWIRLFGYVPQDDILNYVSNFDIGVYPRVLKDFPGRFSVKIAQFMACGVPIVSRETDEALIIKEARCGIVCPTKEDFVRALIELARSPERRGQLGEMGRIYAQCNLDWNDLVSKYKAILVGDL